MAFEIGQRVVSVFMGVGTVKSELFRDDDFEVFQRVLWDNSGIESHCRVSRLAPHEDPAPKKERKKA